MSLLDESGVFLEIPTWRCPRKKELEYGCALQEASDANKALRGELESVYLEKKEQQEIDAHHQAVRRAEGSDTGKADALKAKLQEEKTERNVSDIIVTRPLSKKNCWEKRQRPLDYTKRVTELEEATLSYEDAQMIQGA